MQEQPRIKPKSFTYSTNLRWNQGKLGMLSSDGKAGIEISSPPEFKGEAGYWTPEDLFVASVEMCQMLTFLALAQKKELPLVSYESTAQGTLEFVDGRYRFTRVVINPRVVVEHPGTQEMVQLLMEEAHKRCLVANSITSKVEIEASIIVPDQAASV